MTADYYSPARIDRLLRAWPQLVAQAEGLHSPTLDAFRPARGKPTDPMAAADVVADLTCALAATVDPPRAILVAVSDGNSILAISLRTHQEPERLAQMEAARLVRVRDLVR